MKRSVFCLLLCFFLLGCTTSNAPTPSVTVSVSAVASAMASVSATKTPFVSIQSTATANVQPIASTSVIANINPYHPDNDVKFTLTVTAKDDAGLVSIYWRTDDDFSVKPDSPVFDCSGVLFCTAEWMFSSPTEGYKTITVYSVNGAGLSSSEMDVLVPVGESTSVVSTSIPSGTPWASVEPSIAASEPVCGNAVCDVNEGYEICPSDCLYVKFVCGNGVCEGGESFDTCPQECEQSERIGTSCGDDACQPGEDAVYCAKDCAEIKPNCGNHVCDAWETKDSCYEDCAGVDANAKSCSFNADCGYKEVCRNSKCAHVDCTNDGQCSSGKRCSSNRCVWCPMGPYGRSC